MEKYLESEKTIYSSRAEREKEFEFSLAEYLPGISKIICTLAEVEKCSFNADEKTISSSIKICVIYISDFGDKIKTAVYHESVSALLEGDVPSDEAILFVPSCYVSSIASRSASSRKISTKCNMSFGILGLTNHRENIFCDEEKENIYTQKSTLPCLKKATIPEAVFESTNEISLDENSAGIGEIIYCFAHPKGISARVESGAVNFDFTLSLHVIYEPADEGDTGVSKYAVLNSEINLSERMENSKIHEGMTPYLFIDILSCTPSLSFDPYGENKIVSFSVKYSANALLYSREECEIVTDAFGENGLGDAILSEISIQSLSGKIDSKANISEKLSMDIGEMRQITDCSAKICQVSTEQSEKGLFAHAKCSVTVFAADEDGFPIIKSCFTNLHVPIDSYVKDDLPDVILSIEDCRARLSEGELLCDFDISLWGIMSKKESVMAVSCFTEPSEAAKEGDCEIIVYYPTKNDSLWNVAKKYRKNPDTLRIANGLDNDSIEGKKVLLIP